MGLEAQIGRLELLKFKLLILWQI